MSQSRPLGLDVVIFGGGASGLWLLDELTRAGYAAVVLEAGDLGSGQTIASQGIIHGGLKYALRGLISPSARAIRDMPGIWRHSLAGERPPDLRGTRLRADYCHLWRTDSIGSRLALAGARAGLRVAPVGLEPHERPAVLSSCPGLVARLDEQVIEPVSFLAVLSALHADRILRIDATSGLEFERRPTDGGRNVRLINPDSGEPLDLAPRYLVLVAGAGNARLLEQLELPEPVMQRRPLHMVVARGPLPQLNGHCVDKASTRVTITSTRDFANRVVWQVGGQIAEEGVYDEPRPLIDRAVAELTDVIPGLDLGGTAWCTYRVDRAEAAWSRGRRPNDVAIRRDDRVITAWPTKLALVPRVATRVTTMLDAPAPSELSDPAPLAGSPRPAVAAPPWEENELWITDV